MQNKHDMVILLTEWISKWMEQKDNQGMKITHHMADRLALSLYEKLKKYSEFNISYNVKKVKPKPGDLILLYFNFDELYLDKLKTLNNLLTESYPECSFITLPDSASLQMCNKEQISEWIQMAEEVAKCIED